MSGRFTERNNFKPYFDVGVHGDAIIARAYQEERVTADLSQRVVHAEKYYEGRIERDRWDFNRHSEAEKLATINAFDLAKSGYGLIYWISPKSDVYEEGRFNVMLTGKDENGEYFDPWGVPLLINEEESLELGRRLIGEGGVTMDPVYDGESLRRQPIGFELKDGGDWIDECERLVPELAQVWGVIRAGKVDENMRKIALVVREAREVAGGDNIYFERLMKESGFELNVSGSHGGSWLSMEVGSGSGIIVFRDGEGNVNYRLGSTEGLKFCPKCGCWHSGEKCPVCDK